MKRSDDDHYEKAKCVLVFTDLWLSPEVTAFDVAGWATCIPSWGVVHYREVEASLRRATGRRGTCCVRNSAAQTLAYVKS